MMTSNKQNKSLYSNKLILAPMVRIGTLPSRLTALHFGADLVYSEEIIDFKLLKCRRVENEFLSTTDFITDEGAVVFRTCHQEQGRAILQIGTADADRALSAAKLFEKDVAGIDINMGCPKEFSIKGGMGAALLTQPSKIHKILTTLVQGLHIPVSCKIRILPELEDTLSLVRLIASTGVSALGVHGRYRDERPRHANHNDVIRAIAQEVGHKVVVIANGGSHEIQCHDDIARFKEATGCSSVMLARAAGWNLGIFNPEANLDQVLQYYARQAALYENEWSNTKYCVQYMMREELESKRGKKLTASKTNRQICDIFGLLNFYDQLQIDRMSRKRKCEETEGEVKRKKIDDNIDCFEMDHVKYDKREYDENHSPKLLLYEYCVRQGWVNPEYCSVQGSDKRFESKVKVNGIFYRSTVRLISKRFCEQSAALVCLHVLGIDPKRKPLQPDYSLHENKHTELQNNVNQAPVLGSCRDTVQAPALGSCGDTVQAPALGSCGDTVQAPALGSCGDTVQAPALGSCGDTVQAPVLGTLGDTVQAPVLDTCGNTLKAKDENDSIINLSSNLSSSCSQHDEES